MNDVIELTCANGHRWHQSTQGQTSSDEWECPVCGQSADTLLASQTAVASGTSNPKSASIPGYDLLDVIGQGGMAVVYRARQHVPARLVAIKLLKQFSQDAHDTLSRFRLESESIAQLEHPHIVRIYDVGSTDECHYLALEYVSGGSLATQLAAKRSARRRFSPEEVAQLVEQLASAMEFAHSRNIVHRDLKPHNILMTTKGQPKITDFGLAKRTDISQGRTKTGEILGTPQYMSPEQLTGVTRNLGPATDIYALGVILYELLTDRLPFGGANLMEMITQVTTQDPISPRRLDSSIPRDLETICLRCLEKSPRRRYASAAELAEDLQRYLRHETIRARPADPVTRTSKWIRRHPIRSVIGAFCATGILLSLVFLSWHNIKVRAEYERAEEQRLRAEQMLADVQDVIDSLLHSLRDGELAELADVGPERRRLLEWATQLCGKLQTSNPNTPELQLQQILANRQIADIQQALGQSTHAEVTYRRALRQHLKLPESLRATSRGREIEASLLHNRALLRDALGDLTTAQQGYEESIALWDSIQKEEQTRLPRAIALANLGHLLQRQGKLPQAEKLLQQSFSLTNSDVSPTPQLTRCRATSLAQLGALARDRGDSSAALEYYRNALRDLHDDSVPTRVLKANLANRMGMVYAESGQVEEARSSYLKSLEESEDLVRSSPAVPGHRLAQAVARLNLALLPEANRDTLPEILDSVVDELEQIPDDHAHAVFADQTAALALSYLAEQLATRDEQSAAEQALLRALALQKQLLRRQPDQVSLVSNLALIHHAAADVLTRRKDYSGAAKSLREAVATQRQVFDANREHVVARIRLRQHYLRLIEILVLQGEAEEAVSCSRALADISDERSDLLVATAGLLARCIPLGSAVKGSGSLSPEQIENECVALLLRAKLSADELSRRLQESEDFEPVRDDPRLLP